MNCLEALRETVRAASAACSLSHRLPGRAAAEVLIGILGLAAAATTAAAVTEPVIRTEDVALFYRVYDGADGHPTAEALQHDYLDRGSEGLHQLAKLRNVTGASIAATLAKRPEIYSDARRCTAVLPAVRRRLAAALHKLGELYPDARFPPVTIAIGRGRPVGVGSPATGVQIGLEALCATDYLNPNLEDRFVYVIVHEYAHVQQNQTLGDDPHPTVLQGSLNEGAAEFTAELTAGSVAYAVFAASTRGHERQIETQFLADKDKTDISDWLDNGTPQSPGDLGYWVGYRIVKSYYQHAPDKRAALREILEMSDPPLFLSKSGWYPGIELQ
jgi:hypothetical protein